MFLIILSIFKVFLVSFFTMLFGLYWIGIKEKETPGWMDGKIVHIMVFISIGIAIISSLIL